MSYAKDMSEREVPTQDAAAAHDPVDDLQIGVMRLARRMRAEKGDHGLTLTQLSVLATLARHGAMTPGALAAHERVRPPSMTRTVASLVDAGMCQRSADPSDGRQVIVELTAAARDLLRADRARRRAWLADRLADLTPDERAALATAAPLLDRLAGS